jgi:hypothetical protein
MTRNGWGKKRRINSEPTTPILVAGGEGELKQNLWQTNGSLKGVSHEIFRALF